MLDGPDDLAILEGVIGLAAAFKCEVKSLQKEWKRYNMALFYCT